MVETKTNKKILSGTVVADKMENTVTVLVNRYVKHPKYKKYFKKSKKYKVDDPENKMKVGDKAKIRECKPVSKDKRFRIVY